MSIRSHVWRRRALKDAIGCVLLASILVGCSGNVPGPSVSPGPTEPASSLPAVPGSPPGLGSPPGPGSPPGLESPPVDGEDIIATFLSDFAEGQPPFHVNARIVVSGSSSATITLEMDASGDDYQGDVHSEVAGTVSDAEIIVVDGVAYGRTPGGDWGVIPGYRQTQPINPFDRLEPTEVEYIGPVDRPGAMLLHQLRTTRWIGQDIAELQLDPIVSPALADSTFDIFVADDGVPREAQLRFSITGTSASQPVRIDYVVDYEFSAVGVPILIEPPAIATPAPTGSPLPSPSASPSPTASPSQTASPSPSASRSPVSVPWPTAPP